MCQSGLDSSVELFGSGPCGGGFSASWLTQSCLLTPLITAHLGARAQTNKSSPKQMPLSTAAPPLEQIILLLQCVYIHICVCACARANARYVLCSSRAFTEDSNAISCCISALNLTEWCIYENNSDIMKSL